MKGNFIVLFDSCLIDNRDFKKVEKFQKKSRRKNGANFCIFQKKI